MTTTTTATMTTTTATALWLTKADHTESRLQDATMITMPTSTIPNTLLGKRPIQTHAHTHARVYQSRPEQSILSAMIWYVCFGVCDTSTANVTTAACDTNNSNDNKHIISNDTKQQHHTQHQQQRHHHHIRQQRTPQRQQQPQVHNTNNSSNIQHTNYQHSTHLSQH